jgi:hypothetical protein
MKRILAVITFAVAALSLAAGQRLPEIAHARELQAYIHARSGEATFEGDETIPSRC